MACIRGDPRAPLGGVSSDLLDWSARVSERGEIYYRIYYRGDILRVARAKRAVVVSLMRQYLYFYTRKASKIQYVRLDWRRQSQANEARGKKKVVFTTLSLLLLFIFTLYYTRPPLTLPHIHLLDRRRGASARGEILRVARASGSTAVVA